MQIGIAAVLGSLAVMTVSGLAQANVTPPKEHHG